MKCDTRPDNQPPTADHFPIASQLDFPVKTNSTETARNFRVTDWEVLKGALDDELLDLVPPRELNSKEELIDALDRDRKSVV